MHGSVTPMPSSSIGPAVTVTRPPSQSGTGSHLASTGVPVGFLVALVIVLLVLGLVAMRAGRRKP